MRVIIAGSRYIIDNEALFLALEQAEIEGIRPTTILQGGARGVDELALIYGVNYDIPVLTFKADWDKHGYAAGPIRNKMMATNADALIAIWDGRTQRSGTYNMISEALAKRLKVFVLLWTESKEE